MAFADLQNKVHNDISSRWDFLTNITQERVQRMIADLGKDENVAEQGARAYRFRRDPRRVESHLALSIEDYAPIVQHIIQKG